MSRAWTLIAVFVAGCATLPPEVPQLVCRGLAIDFAERSATELCGAYSEWDACPDARQIEDQLMRDLEKCDGE